MPAKASSQRSKSKAPRANSKSKTLSFKQTVNVPPAEAFRAFTHGTLLRDWFCDAAQAERRKGGLFHLGWNSGHYVSGQFLIFEPGKRLVFTWDGKGEPEPTKVQVTFKAKGEGTVVTLSHSGVGSGTKWASTIHGITHGWPSGLENLKSVLETGIDLRFARRPRLGIFIDEFNPDIAGKIGVPVKDGIRLAGTADGSGARAAGLQKDDVIVKFGGKNVNTATLGEVVPNYTAGDKVPVVFYRGGEKKTVPLELSRFPIPEVPSTATELAEAVRKTYVELNAEFEKALEGVTEAEADCKAGSEWSVRELIAHFIAGERDFQSWVADMLNDTPVEDYLEFRPNVNERLRALVARFRTIPALLDEMKHVQDETASLLAALPSAFVARQHLYRRAARWMLEVVPGHFRSEHSEQLKAAIAAARKQ